MTSSLTVSTKGQVTLKRELLQHLGIKPGEQLAFEKLPGGELRIRAAHPTGTIEDFFNVLEGKAELSKPLSIDDMNRIAAAGWAGERDES